MRCSKELIDEEEYCPDCLRKKFHFIRGYAVWNYDRQIAESISRFKFHDKEEYGIFFGKEMARLYGSWLIQKGIQGLIPVPIYKKKKSTRGFNQAEILANTIGSQTGIPVLKDVLVRERETKPQKELSHLERQKNLKGAFVGKEETLGKINRVVLIDDIYTTGSTVETCTKVLLSMKIKEVYFLCISIGRIL